MVPMTSPTSVSAMRVISSRPSDLERAGRKRWRCGSRRFRRRAAARRRPRDAEVHDDRVLTFEHHVGRLQITMDHAGLVSGLESCGNLPGEGYDLRDGKPAHAKDAREVLALDVRHRDVS
jgi:hypothetical protein